MTRAAQTIWTFAITSIALFMVTLDNLVVTTALPVIRKDLHATLEGLEWTVNAYTLTFAVLLLTGAALGDRFGRRRMFVDRPRRSSPLASAAAALAPSIEALIAARALQGVGGAIVMPLTLTILSRGRPGRAARRSRSAPGAAIGGLAVALGPLVGGAVVSGHLVAVDLLAQRADRPRADPARAAAPRREPRARRRGSTCPGLGLASVGLLGIVWGLVRGNGQGWTSPEIVGVARRRRVVLVAAFVALGAARRRRRCCRCASSATAPSRWRTSRRC